MKQDFLITWNPSPSKLVRKYRVLGREGGDEFKLLGESVLPEFRLSGVEWATYDIAVVAIGVNGVESTPVVLRHDVQGLDRNLLPVGGMTLMDEPTSTTFESQSPRIRWDAADDAFVTQYGVSIFSTGMTRLHGPVFTTATEITLDYETLKAIGLLRTFVVEVVTYDKFGFKSAESTLTVSNAAPAAPTDIVFNSSIGGCQISATLTPIRDLGGMVVAVGTTSGFNPTTSIVHQSPALSYLHTGAVQGTYYARVAYYDIYNPNDFIWSAEHQFTLRDVEFDDQSPALKSALLAAHDTIDATRERLDEIAGVVMGTQQRLHDVVSETTRRITSESGRARAEIREVEQTAADETGALALRTEALEADMSDAQEDLNAHGSAIQSTLVRVEETEEDVSSLAGTVSTHTSQISGLNTGVNNAQNAAQAASDLAGGKGKVIYGSTAPATADREDQNLWIDTTGGANTPKRWNGSAWVAVTDKVATDATTAASNAMTAANNAQVTANSGITRVEAVETTQGVQGNTLSSLAGTVSTHTSQIAVRARTFAQNTTPTATAAGDLWVKTDDGNKLHRWSGSAWVVVQDTGKNRTFAQGTAPTATAAGDIWINTSQGNKVSRWSGSAWVDITDTRLTTAAADISTLQSTKVDLAGATAAAQTLLNATFGAGSAGVKMRLAALATPSGYDALFEIEVSATGGTGTFKASGLLIAVLTVSGTQVSRIEFKADQVVYRRPSDNEVVLGWDSVQEVLSIFGGTFIAGVIRDTTGPNWRFEVDLNYPRLRVRDELGNVVIIIGKLD